MVLIGILTVHLNGVILLHLQKKKNHCEVLYFSHSDNIWVLLVLDAGRNTELSCALNRGLGLAFHTSPRAHVCIADLGVCGSFECAYERGQGALETCMVRRLPMIPSLDST